MAEDSKPAARAGNDLPPPVLPAAPAAAPVPGPVARLHALIDKWFVEVMHNSPVSAVTEAFNHTRAAVADLKRRIEEDLR